MAATNFTPIQLYYSSTASAAPTAGNLTSGELAINITDGKLYYKDNGGVVQVIATKGAGTIGGSTTQIQYNNAGALAGNAAMTFNSGTNTTTLTTLNLTNALGAVYGGTAQSTYTQGDVLYASASNTLAKLGIGTVNYILTSSGSVPQWSAPSSISVLTATNLAGGLGGSVPYQSAVDTTTFLAIGAANRVMTSTGSAPQWVTSLTGLTGVSSSSITNTSLTSGRVVYSGASGVQTDSASLTFNGTTLSAGGFSTTGLSTLVQTVKIGDSNFSGVAVFAPATPAKLYIGTGTVTDATSAIGATNTTGAISSLAITPIAATNTSVTYTNASTLYIAGAPSAGTNITITNPYALYVAAGTSYFGGAVNFATTPIYSGGTANGVMYLDGSKNITTGTALAFDGATLSINNGVVSASLSLTGTYAASGTVPFINFQRLGGAVAGTLGYDDANNAIRFGTTTSHTLVFLQDNLERGRFSTAGNLLIGTTSNQAKLTVNGGAFFGQVSPKTRFVEIGTTGFTTMRYDDNGFGILNLQNLGLTGANQGYRIIAQFSDDATNTYNAGYLMFISEGAYTGATSTQDSALTFATATDGVNYEKVRITSTGRVGVNITAPSSILEVVGASAIDTTGASGAWTVRLRDTAATALAGTGSSLLFQGIKATGGGVGNYAGIAGLKENNTNNNENGYLGFFTVSNSNGLLAERGRFTSAGNLILGTVSDQNRRLQVSGTIGLVDAALNSIGDMNIDSSGVMYISPYNGSGSSLVISTNPSGGGVTKRMEIASNGQVGIGNITPGQSLDVDGNIRSRDGGISLSVGTTQQAVFCTYNRIFGSGTDYTPTIFAESGLGITFVVNGVTTKAMSLTSGGNLLVGTTSTTGGFPLRAKGGGVDGSTTVTVPSGVTTTIYTIPNTATACMCVVFGDNGSNGFCDLLFFLANTTPQVVSSKTMYGSPPARTYSVASSTQLQINVAMDSSTRTAVLGTIG
jgi:hypothetical protein